jgi:hypothetical protein
MIKFTLDSKALERLIGGDTELESELRNSVVADFSRRYLKGVVESAVLSPLFSRIEAGILAEAKLQIGKKGKGFQEGFEFTFEVKEYIRKALVSTIQLEIIPIISKQVEQLVAEGQIKFLVERQVHAIVDAEVRKQVTAKLEKILKT